MERAHLEEHSLWGGGGNRLKAWSKGQIAIALSSAESELYAPVTAVAEPFGLQALFQDAGMKASTRVMADASAALGIIERKGLGKARHLDTSRLWSQEVAAKKKVEFHKVKGTENPADLMAKELASIDNEKYTRMMGSEYAKGEAAILMEIYIKWEDLWRFEPIDEQRKEQGFVVPYAIGKEVCEQRKDEGTREDYQAHESTHCGVHRDVSERETREPMKNADQAADMSNESEDVKHFKLFKRKDNTIMSIGREAFIIGNKQEVEDERREGESRSSFLARKLNEVVRKWLNNEIGRAQSGDRVRRESETRE